MQIVLLLRNLHNYSNFNWIALTIKGRYGCWRRAQIISLFTAWGMRVTYISSAAQVFGCLPSGFFAAARKSMWAGKSKRRVGGDVACAYDSSSKEHKGSRMCPTTWKAGANTRVFRDFQFQLACVKCIHAWRRPAVTRTEPHVQSN